MTGPSVIGNQRQAANRLACRGRYCIRIGGAVLGACDDIPAWGRYLLKLWDAAYFHGYTIIGINGCRVDAQRDRAAWGHR